MTTSSRAASVFAVFVFSACAQPQSLSVTGDAEIKVVPDQVVMSLGVEVHAKALADARRENDSRVRAVRAAAKRFDIDDKDVQTDFIQLGMAYQTDGVTPDYYYTRKSIVFVLHDVTRMEEVLAAAVDAGATHIHGVEFETTKLREYRDKARAMAVQAAKDKARDVAAAAGMKVVGTPLGISDASYGGNSWYGSGWGGWGRSRGALSQNVMMDNGAGSAGGTIALGRISVTASVSMTFRIE
jgi:uncharacterized protein YggE